MGDRDLARGAGLVLAGGLSRRMGQDKASLTVIGDRTMLEVSFNLLHSLLPQTWVSCARGKPVAGYPCIEDQMEGFGPAGGICSAMEILEESEFIFVLPCDMPLMARAPLAALLAAHLQEPTALATMYTGITNGRYETLPAIYSRAGLKYFRQALAAGHRSLWNIIPLERQRHVTCPDKFKASFYNCNTPEELKTLAEKLPNTQPEQD